MEQLNQFVTLTPAQFAAVLAVVVPGFLSFKLQQALESRSGRGGVEAFVEIIGFSLLNAFAMSWPIDIIRRQMASGVPDPAIVAPNAVLVCIVGPLLWPILLHLGKRHLLRGRWLWGEQKTAFDAFFSTGQPCWVVVHLTDGREVAGYFGGQSYASADTAQGDLFIEEVWRRDADGRWLEPVADSKGALFRQIDTLWMEFFWDRPAPGDAAQTVLRPSDPHIRRIDEGYAPKPGPKIPPRTQELS